MSSLRDVASTANVLIVCGAGGVGKTSTAAAIGLAKAKEQIDLPVLVVTIDPARRLADALGMEPSGNAIAEVPGTGAKLHSLMLDTRKSWDDLVIGYAPEPETAKRIMSNPLYVNITERFVQSHDYIAMERLHELHASGEYSSIVIDTPPARRAVDFLDAPDRMASFFDSRLLKFLVAPQRGRITSLGARPFLYVANRLLGSRFLDDITEFFGLLESMRPGFILRAREVERLLRAETTSFIVVTTPEPASRRDAERFMDALDERRLHAAGAVVNKVMPQILDDKAHRNSAERLRSEAAAMAHAMGPDVEEERLARVLEEIGETFERFGVLGDREKDQERMLRRRVDSVVSVPWFEAELHDVNGLERFGGRIWR